MNTKRISNHDLKKNFNQFKSTNLYIGNNVLISYGLIVGLYVNGQWTSSNGYHDFSTTTSKQITTATRVDTATRRKTWNIISEEEFINLSNDYINSLNL